MTALRIIVPYNRPAKHITRRDLAIAAGDSLALRVTVVEDDSPRAYALDITEGLGGPALGVQIWADTTAAGSLRDYDSPMRVRGAPLWTGSGDKGSAVGTFNVDIPARATVNWPRRCGWAVRMTWPDDQAMTLAVGTLNVVGPRVPFAATPEPPTVTPGTPLLTDEFVPLLAADGTPLLIST